MDNRRCFERVWGGGPDGQIVSIQGGMSTPRKILGDAMSKQDEEDWTNYQALEDPSTDAEGKAAGTTNLDFSSTIRKEGEYPKNEARGEFERKGVYETEQSARPSRKPWRSQQMPKWFGLEAFSFGSRPRLVETE